MRTLLMAALVGALLSLGGCGCLKNMDEQCGASISRIMPL